MPPDWGLFVFVMISNEKISEGGIFLVDLELTLDCKLIIKGII